MSFDLERLYALLPEYRRSQDLEQGAPLKALLSVIGDQVAILEEGLAQLRDDQSVETCAPWLLPYVGDLIGITGLPAVAPQRLNPRAEVANTIGYRRRKGTAAMLEQLARDITGWPARAVEFFQLLATTQHMNHVRLENRSFLSGRGSTGRQVVARLLEQIGVEARTAGFIDYVLDGTGASRDALVRAGVIQLRIADGLYILGPTAERWSDPDLELVETPFERTTGGRDVTHTADVRLIASGRGSYNIPNVGLFLWRLFPYPLTNAAPFKVDPDPDDHRYTFHPFGLDSPLFSAGRTEADSAHLAEPLDVPAPISRRALAASLEAYWGVEKSLVVQKVSAAPCDPDPDLAEPTPFAIDNVEVCDLSDWSHEPSEKEIAIDPVLGRFVLREAPAHGVTVCYHHGFSSDLGGGEYRRIDTFDALITNVISVGPCAPDQNEIQDALDALPDPDGGVVEIVDSRKYAEPVSIPSRKRVELRAAQGRRGILVPSGDLQISGSAESEVTINGLLIAGPIVVDTRIRRLRLRHCTLVSPLPNPSMPQVSLRVLRPDVSVEIDHCIIGGLRIDPGSDVRITNSILDAGLDTLGHPTRVAYAAADGAGPGGTLHLENSTVIGKVHTDELELASNTIFLAALAAGDTWTAPVRSRRRQEGCVRFSYLPAGAITPRRYRCQPEVDGDADRLRPRLRSYRWTDASYAQLADSTPVEIRRGADDDSEMGAFHELYQPQREDHLRARLEQFLRFGLEAGVFHVT